MPFLTTALVAGGIAAAGAVGAGALKAHAAGEAASAQQASAQQAAALEKQNQQNAINYQQGIWNNTQSAEKPYQNLGRTASNNLTALLSKGFQAPTLAEAENNPGYQFQLQQGTTALDQGAAARGNLFSGTQGKALTSFGQGLAQTDYQQVYQNALQNYMANYNTLLGGTDVGLNSTAQLASAGQASAANMANIDLTGGQQQASQINNAGAARASGIVNSANAWGGAISGVTNDALGVYAQDTAGNIGTSLFHQAGGGAGVNSPNAIPLESAQLPNSIPMPPPVDPLTQSPYFNPYQSSYGR